LQGGIAEEDGVGEGFGGDGGEGEGGVVFEGVGCAEVVIWGRGGGLVILGEKWVERKGEVQILRSGPERSSLRRMIGQPRFMMVWVAWWMWNVSIRRLNTRPPGTGTWVRFRGLRSVPPAVLVSG